MFHEYLQVFVFAGNRENLVNIVNRSPHLKGDITAFTPVGHGRRVTSVFFEKAELCSEYDLQGLGFIRELQFGPCARYRYKVFTVLWYGKEDRELHFGNLLAHTSPRRLL